jgi:hypothetical protein
MNDLMPHDNGPCWVCGAPARAPHHERITTLCLPSSIALPWSCRVPRNTL